LIGIDTSALVALENKSHPDHAHVVQTIRKHLKRGERFALCPQVASEFIHVATDPARFPTALTMAQALAKMEWWSSVEQCRWVYPDDESLALFLNWMGEYRLGRKRVLDTMLAATYAVHGVTKLAALDRGDFQPFDQFEFVL
jgi:predicted nucleic acid-binding protein